MQEVCGRSSLRQSSLSKLKGCASVALSPVTSQRVATKGAFATHATGTILLVCMKRETKVKQSPSQDRSTTRQEWSRERPQATQRETIAVATSNRVILEENNKQTSAIIPVWLSSAAQPSQEVLTYALLDSQSDTTFVLSEVVNALEADKEQVKLKLSTMTS